MKRNRIKLFVAAAAIVPMSALAVFNMSSVNAGSPLRQNASAARNEASRPADDDVAAQYKKTCAVCHSPTASKFFEPSKMDEVHVEIVLKGKKAEKPPHMPAYEPKGMTKDQAKLLVAYMRQIRTPPSPSE